MLRKPRIQDQIEEINIMPLLNIIMLLIPFLIMSTEFIRVGVVEVSAPSMCGVGCGQDPKITAEVPLNLTLSVSRSGLTLLTRGAKIAPACELGAKAAPLSNAPQGPTFMRNGTKINHVGLQACLIKIKAIFPKEQTITIMAEEGTPYNEIIRLMDTSREDAQRKELFPRVLLAAGVL